MPDSAVSEAQSLPAIAKTSEPLPGGEWRQPLAQAGFAACLGAIHHAA